MRLIRILAYNRFMALITWLGIVISQGLLFSIARNVANSGKAAQPIEQFQRMFLIMAIGEFFLALVVVPRVFSISRGQPLFARMIVQWFLFESITLLGFILALQAVSVNPMIPFISLSLLGLTITNPFSVRISS